MCSGLGKAWVVFSQAPEEGGVGDWARRGLGAAFTGSWLTWHWGFLRAEEWEESDPVWL